MKRGMLAAGAVALVLSATACAQPYPMGPEMMGGYGPGIGMGPGMMGGYGHGYGMGPGMVRGHGHGYGVGPGMMWGYGLSGLDLSDEQRAKIAHIQKEFAGKHWQLMDKLHAKDGPMSYGPGGYDEKQARSAYDAMAATHKQMFEYSLQARQRVDEVLTPEQRAELQKRWGGH